MKYQLHVERIRFVGFWLRRPGSRVVLASTPYSSQIPQIHKPKGAVWYEVSDVLQPHGKHKVQAVVHPATGQISLLVDVVYRRKFTPRTDR